MTVEEIEKRFGPGDLPLRGNVAHLAHGLIRARACQFALLLKDLAKNEDELRRAFDCLDMVLAHADRAIK